MSNILQNIFKDHYEEMIYTLHPRKTVIDNVDKMINCGDPSFGGAMYGCSKCGNMKFVPFRCHSRFCPTCGVKYSMDRTTSMSLKIISAVHRHCVFTIADELREYFLHDRSLLNLLFDAVNQTIKYMFHELNKTMNYIPGFILVLHTFGRDLKWNPHIHCLLSEGGLSNVDRSWRHVRHFNYTFLRNSFRMVLLNLLEKKLGPSFKKVKAMAYKDHPNGFYVYAKPTKCQPKDVIKYIGRYLGRPVIATSRIDNYDGDNVTFHYNRHEDNKYVVETIPVMDFIKRLIVHIPDRQFKMIRYYGIYADTKYEHDPNVQRAITGGQRQFYLRYNDWCFRICNSFGYNPLICKKCNTRMDFLELYFNHKRVPLEELYKKAMYKHGLRPA